MSRGFFSRCAIFCAAALLAQAAWGQDALVKGLIAINKALETIQKEYLEPVEAGRLVEGCKRNLLPGLEKAGIKLQKLPEVETPLGAFEQIWATLEPLAKQHPSAAGLLPELCLAGMLGSLDPLTRYVGEEQLRNERKLSAAPAAMRATPVHIARLPGDYVRVRITRFQADTLEKFVQGMADELARRQAAGIVLDLRGNTGGLLDPSVAVSSFFLLPFALVVEMKGRGGRNPARRYARTEDDRIDPKLKPLADRLYPSLAKLPVVALVDRDTASGAEIVAAALQDYGRAMILTTAAFFRPNGEPIEKRPLAPDVRVADMAVNGASDPALAAALTELKK